jgi:hypothetical protein
MYFCLISQLIMHWLTMPIYDWEFMSDIYYVFLCILMLDGCFSYVIVICALSKAPIRCIFFFSLTFSFWKFLWKIICFAKMVKLTNLLVEPRTYEFWHSFKIAAPSDKKHLNFSCLDNKKIHCLLCYKSVLKLIPKETVSDQIIAKIYDHYRTK